MLIRCILWLKESQLVCKYLLLTTMRVLFQVTYQTEFFLDKNKDYVIAEHQALLNASTCSFVANLFPPLSDDSKQSKFSSIGTRFKVSQIFVSTFTLACFNLFFKGYRFHVCASLQQQLVSLLEILNTTEPHYIRCIKPNNLLKPGIFENQNVLQQLRCGVRMTSIFS